MLTTRAPWLTTRRQPRDLLVLLALAAAALAILIAHPPAAAPSTAAPETDRTAPALGALAAPGPHESSGSACWVTGDLVGEANPATVAAMACTTP